MSALTLSLLRILSDGAFHSGEALAQHFGLSRTRIWQALQTVEELGVRVFKVKGRGYQLADPIEWLAIPCILPYLGDAAPTITFTLLDSVDSTNTLLMQALAQRDVHAHCVAAEIQTKGRGRRGRQWHGALGGSLMFSLAWRFNLGVAQLSGLSLTVGLALARALQELTVPNVQLKWPNDLMQGFRKLGGVLIEIQGDALGPSSAVIGVGINVRLPEGVKDRIDQAVVDLQGITITPPSRNQLLGVVLRHLAQLLDQFSHSGFEAIRAEWEGLHAHQHKHVTLRLPDGAQISGVALGVTADGALILDTAHGERRFGSGEISLRPTTGLSQATP